MNKWLAGGAALGFAAVGSVVLAGPGSAQPAALEATIEPTTVEQGGTVTLSSVDPCLDDALPGTLTVDIFFEDDADPFQTDQFDLTEEEDPEGQWVLEYTGEPDEPTGTYTYIVTCFADGEEGALIGEYNELVSEVIEAPPSTEPPSTPPGPPTPPPAPPVTRIPNNPG